MQVASPVAGPVADPAVGSVAHLAAGLVADAAVGLVAGPVAGRAVSAGTRVKPRGMTKCPSPCRIWLSG